MEISLADALGLVVRDLERTGGLTLRVLDEPVDNSYDYESVWMMSAAAPGRTGLMAPRWFGDAERVVHVADQVQEFILEELWGLGRSATWPECAEHPGSHPLEARLTDDGPGWVCPKSGRTGARIGELG
ncbi:hypothetical protein [Kribbella italica]|uniref:Uncharacterized protein n=1 Tax=Kribbella italica TaxID=1540520 RepID=A0A7W9J9X0_9ACTN|nr:hypothetical protein [Kribbella italica]MBB5837850.1 hypothetical protein [Kribbella italica]